MSDPQSSLTAFNHGSNTGDSVTQPTSNDTPSAGETNAGEDDDPDFEPGKVVPAELHPDWGVWEPRCSYVNDIPVVSGKYSRNTTNKTNDGHYIPPQHVLAVLDNDAATKYRLSHDTPSVTIPDTFSALETFDPVITGKSITAKGYYAVTGDVIENAIRMTQGNGSFNPSETRISPCGLNPIVIEHLVETDDQTYLYAPETINTADIDTGYEPEAHTVNDITIPDDSPDVAERLGDLFTHLEETLGITIDEHLEQRGGKHKFRTSAGETASISWGSLRTLDEMFSFEGVIGEHVIPCGKFRAATVTISESDIEHGYGDDLHDLLDDERDAIIGVRPEVAQKSSGFGSRSSKHVLELHYTAIQVTERSTGLRIEVNEPRTRRVRTLGLSSIDRAHGLN